MDARKAKLLLAGDGCVGKTSMLMSYPNKTRLPGHPWEVGQVSRRRTCCFSVFKRDSFTNTSQAWLAIFKHL